MTAVSYTHLKIRLATYLSPIACICEHIYDTSNPPYYSTIPSPLMVPASVIKFSVFRSFGAMEGMVL